MTQRLRKVYIKTFGCQMNEYDTAKMLAVLKNSHGLLPTEQAEEADVLLLNTCSVREKAQEKVFSEIGRWRDFKKAAPHKIIGVGGCVASQEGAEILKRAPEVDIVFGPQTLHRLPLFIEEVQRRRGTVVDVSFPEIEKFDHLPEPRAEGAQAYVSIMEGCSKFCTYCVVPYTRGAEVSRPFDDVLAECAQLAEQGVRELHLLGQNVNAYRGVMDDGHEADLALLLEYVAAIPGVARIRYTTSNPIEFNDDLVAAYKRIPTLVGHLHLPVQSGSDRILALMKRGYTVADYEALLCKIRAARPGIALSSDFIVGFPGESEEDFEQTLDLIRRVVYDVSFSFIYSSRPGTPASTMPDNVPLKVKKMRLQILQKLLREQAQAIAEAMLGTQQWLLVDRMSKKNDQELSGRTENNRVVNFQGSKSLLGRMVLVEITAVNPNSLRGRVIKVEGV